ncbi:DUF4145 domain-containing protein [Rhodoblastus sp.]|uniref:DUF4145 domain-containing protein n=1 Tax=Rhodoblastus sp. TaxID=1962975 RepID=UPI003F982023
MFSESRDSAEVANFLTLYTTLKDLCDDDPIGVFKLAIADRAFKGLCMKLLNAANTLHANEQRRPQLFAAPVDPNFLFAWRDFEARYEHVLAANWSTFVFGDQSKALTDKSRDSNNADRKWESADLNAGIAADLIEAVIGGARVEDFHYSMSTEEVAEMATDYWEGLRDEVGFDLTGVFRRRRLVPFVLVPRHIAARHSSPETAAFYESLRQAHDAFIFGVPLAALALMRSIMETVLRDHYNVRGDDLSEQINSARKSLPAGANEAALHRLRKLANTVLHNSADRNRVLQLEPPQLEKEMVSLLTVLRALIEGVPQSRHRQPG